jgi:hypothetical protein
MTHGYAVVLTEAEFHWQSTEMTIKACNINKHKHKRQTRPDSSMELNVEVR